MSNRGGEQGRRLLPQRIGRYEILGELGVGGMAVVYLARAQGIGSFERLVAIKRMHEHLCRDEGFVKMFLDEARVAARLHHPNVVAVHEVDEDEGRYYIVMDYVRGEPLSYVLNQAWRGPHAEPFSPAIGALLFSEIADAIHSAHELRDFEGRSLNVVHRDISTRNLLLGYDGLLRLLDFGVVKTEDQSHKTRTGAQKGTVAYMSPEQVLGRPLDRRVDIFSLGIVLWEATVGKRLFQAENDFATAARVRQASVPRPSVMRPGYPRTLENVVMRALEREPDRRYQSARELRDGLVEFLAEVPAVVPQTARDYLERIAPGRLAAKIEAERGALFESSRRIPLQRYSSEEVDLESAAGLPEFTMPESARKTARVVSGTGAELSAISHISQVSTTRAPVPDLTEDEPLRTYHAAPETARTDQGQTSEDETIQDGEARVPVVPTVRERRPTAGSNLRVIANSMPDTLAPSELSQPPLPVSRSRLVSGLSLNEGSTMASGPFELKPEDLLEISGDAAGFDNESNPTARAPPPAPEISLDEVRPLPQAPSRSPSRALSLDEDLIPPPPISRTPSREVAAELRVGILADLPPQREHETFERRTSGLSRASSIQVERGERGRTWAIAGALLIVASVAGGAALQLFVQKRRPPTPPVELRDPPAVHGPAASQSSSSTVATAATATRGIALSSLASSTVAAPAPNRPPPTEPAGPPAPIELRLSGLPAGTKIEASAAIEGTTLRVLASNEPITIKLGAPGYRPLELKLAPDSSRTVPVKMRRGRR
ncbi:MAG: serine/threonine-protein kinase [Myxococcota bacterium]